MTFQFHTTIFGQLVRLLSGGKRFRYPDEVDPFLWKKAVRQDTLQHTNASPKESANDIQDGQVPPKGGLVRKDDQHILLVDWYGPDDPEVSAGSSSLLRQHLT
jgi:DHA1 family multidrug resistance protein-like MFS transporter